ncbi:aminoglycoside phosphotransferase family protein [Kineosporia babensis]|uniref:Aminoglycoside phosphotransferase family protein n=1 Tax=Kineosporia babensis TaxID=499548 RepID=A0A9X1NG20_9ACTN|nr:aminoglycoside phosphotransferase family protein [Kineosporia babensis]MCD5312393.1 aminoglycoside phosphotransferase family protein [Kineosporia babensis]
MDSSWALKIPAEFAAGVVGHTGDAGRAWLRDLPSLALQLLERWDLQPDGSPMHGYLGLVLPVRQGALPGALKISQVTPETLNQAAALDAWDGRGMVQLLDSSPAEGALLLERLDYTRALEHLPILKAVPAAGLLLRRLSLPSSASLPTLTDHVAGWPERWAAGASDLLPHRYFQAAHETCRALGPQAGRLLVDHDLHYANVLAGEREPWLAVDPRGLLGDPEFALAPLMWRRFDEMPIAQRFDLLVESAELDRDRARGWLLVRAFDYFLWSTGIGLTWDPAACREILDWLLAQRIGG